MMVTGEDFPKGVVIMAQGTMPSDPDLGEGPSQFVEEGLVPSEVFTKRLKFALDAQGEDGETFEAIHRLLREAKRAGIVSLSLIHSMMLGRGVSVIMSVAVEVREGDTLRVREHEASPKVVTRLMSLIGDQGDEWPWEPLPRHSLV